MSRFTESLIPQQLHAVKSIEGPLLILAGAGSGKTRVITHRVAHLILEAGVHPTRIAAVTFTNKAAAEMRERVQALMGSRIFGSWIGTFHAFCLRILRRDGHLIGLEPGFNVYDGADQLAVVKRILKSEAGDVVTGTPRSFLSRISRHKNAMESPEDVDKKAYSPELKLLASVYRQYQEESGQPIEPVVVEEVLRVTNGQPGLVSWFGELLTETYNPGNNQTIGMETWKTVWSKAAPVSRGIAR